MLEAFGFSPTRAVQKLTRYLLALSLALARVGACSSDFHRPSRAFTWSNCVTDEFHEAGPTHTLYLAHASDSTIISCLLISDLGVFCK